MNITYVIEETPLGTAGALKNVEEYITGPFFVLNGDVLTSLDLRGMVAEHERKGGIGLLHLIRVEDPSAFGCVVHDGDGRISAFVEKPPRETAPTNEINAGTYLFERDILDMIPAGRNVSIERETFPQVIASGKGLYAYTTSDYWMDIGKPEQYLAAHVDILAGRMPLLEIEPGATGEGKTALAGVANVTLPVHADAGVRIDPTATVGPNVVLGTGVSIGPRAIVRDSVLWDGVRIEEEASVEGSIVASDAVIGARASVPAGGVIGHDAVIETDTVLDPGARVGATEPMQR
jgi:mannose-1-phosphate guanylyltransferase